MEAVKLRITTETQSVQESIAFSNTVLLGVMLSALAIGVAFAVSIARSIAQSLMHLSSSIKALQRTGDFSLRIHYPRKDEIGEVAQAMNQLLVGLEQSISEANQVVSAIAQAQFNVQMSGQYVGDLDRLKQGINASAKSVAFMMQELEKVMQGLASGRFNVQMDPQVPAAFRRLVDEAFQSIERVITDILDIMSHMSDGDFSVRVNVPAQGDLLTLKDSINHSMSDLADVVRLMSDVVSAQAEGDLTKSLKSGIFKGQLHDLKNAINYSASRMNESVVLVLQSSQIVNEAAAQVSQGSMDLSGRVQEQAAALEQTSATMNEMAIAVQANTANAHKVSELAHQVRHQTTAGVEVMQKTISAMQSIKASSSQIADIVTLIDGIAFQTNLLALNAAVEAARAGEHGRGFAVVAGEVRALAQKSASAAKDIKDLITESVHRIEVGTQLADKSGEMLNGITDSIGQVASMVEHIASASSEQSDGIHQVHRAIANIDKVTQENAALVEETTAAAESLNMEASHLRENMSFFKTDRA